MSRDFKGNAVVTTLATGISAGDTSISLVAATNWPTGTGADQFVVLIVSADGATREKVLIESRSSTTLTVATSGRGYDGTVASSFSAGASVMVVMDAAWAQEVDDHLNDTGRDDHTQYLDETRHADVALHAFGAALGTPGLPVDIGTASSEGVDDAPARGDHVHVIGSGAISSEAMFGDDVVSTRVLGANAVQPGNADSSLVGGGVGMAFGIFYVKVDETTIHLNGSGELEVLGGVVSTGGIADGAITNGKLATDAVTADKIATGAVGADEIVDGGVGTAELADAAVTAAKLVGSLPQGRVGRDTKVTSQSGITANVAISGLAASATPTRAGRRWQIVLTAPSVSGTIGGEVAKITLKRDGTTVGAAYFQAGEHVCHIWDDDGPSVASHTYTIEMQRFSGTGTMSIDADATNPITLRIMDVGGT